MIADLLVKDREGRPVLFVEVKGRPVSDRDFADWVVRSVGRPSDVRFAMLVDPDRTRTVSALAADPGSLVDEFPTRDVLAHYDRWFEDTDPSHGSARGFKSYLAGLIEVWLLDLVDPWKPGEAPRRKEFTGAGLLGRIEGGSVVAEEMVRDNPVP